MDLLGALYEIFVFIKPLIYLGAGIYLLISAGAAFTIYALIVARTGNPKI